MSFAELKEKIIKNYDTTDITLVERAYKFAEKVHEGQTRKSGDAYITHPLAIASALADLKLDQATIAAALLHDVIEDGGATEDDVKKEFGEDVAFLVEGVTKLGKLKYRGAERMAESLRKMFLATAEDIRVVLIKLMDRAHNMETLRALPEEKQKRIALETLEIYAPLADRLGLGQLKARLEDLAFPYVYPEEYQWLQNNVKEAFKERVKYIEHIMPVVRELLSKENIPVLAMDARAKHQYSLWRKLAKFDMDVTKINDLVALRIIVPTVSDCYQALGAIHAGWRPLPGKIKDYIALPKPNGYKSLHTTVFGPDGEIVEFQIRTEEMHEEAEHGIAAHWAYNEHKKTKGYKTSAPSEADKDKIHWVSQLKDWQKDVPDPNEFLNSLKIEFFKNRIFVLTPKGDAIDLPEGATALDFAYHVHSQIGDTASGARVNGKMVPLNHELSNFDVAEIITQKNKKPSADWLGFVKTSMARRHITSKIRRAEEDRRFSEHQGKQMVEVRVIAKDRVGLVNDLTAVVASFKINIKGMRTERGERSHPLVLMNCPVKSNDEMRKLLMKLKSVRGVEEVGYRII
ncbi:MAG: RelA/SpoT family protein [Candidatus Sungbacteria bacterium]|nr:RelA/SpoT family protein [Candidatus Sungbacteria bacterium]